MPQDYLLADQPSELERLRLQSLVWEPTGRHLLTQLENGSGGRALDVGCGALGWLRILTEWVGPSGRVVGTDIDESLLNVARSLLEAEGIANVELVVDDLFDTKLEPQSFDLVHAATRSLRSDAAGSRWPRTGGC
jgi:ubiquinone/menaquinone biosynthesis C-methylase UbiE